MGYRSNTENIRSCWKEGRRQGHLDGTHSVFPASSSSMGPWTRGPDDQPLAPSHTAAAGAWGMTPASARPTSPHLTSATESFKLHFPLLALPAGVPEPPYNCSRMARPAVWLFSSLSQSLTQAGTEDESHADLTCAKHETVLDQSDQHLQKPAARNFDIHPVGSLAEKIQAPL